MENRIPDVLPAALIDEPVVAVQPSLIRALGPAPAILFQQIHYRLRIERPASLSEAVLGDLTGMTRSQIRTAGKHLIDSGVLTKTKPRAAFGDHTAEYDIDYETLVSVVDKSHDGVATRLVRSSHSGFARSDHSSSISKRAKTLGDRSKPGGGDNPDWADRQREAFNQRAEGELERVVRHNADWEKPETPVDFDAIRRDNLGR